MMISPPLEQRLAALEQQVVILTNMVNMAIATAQPQYLSNGSFSTRRFPRLPFSHLAFFFVPHSLINRSHSTETSKKAAPFQALLLPFRLWHRRRSALLRSNTAFRPRSLLHHCIPVSIRSPLHSQWLTQKCKIACNHVHNQVILGDLPSIQKMRAVLVLLLPKVDTKS